MLSMIVSLVATIACLGAAIWAGIAHKRSLHYGLVAGTFALLGVAIWRAEAYGRTLVFEGASAGVHRVHMVVVALAFLCVPFVLWTGWKLARASGPSAAGVRAGHHRAAVVFVVLIVVAAALGTLMTVLAQPA